MIKIKQIPKIIGRELQINNRKIKQGEYFYLLSLIKRFPFVILRETRLRLRKHKDVVVVSFPKTGRTWLKVILDKLGLYFLYTHDETPNASRVSYRELSKDKSVFRNNKVIFLVRDPRDAVVSNYFQAKNREYCYKGTLSDFIRDEKHGIEKILHFYNNWYEQKQVKNILILTYEDLRKNTKKEIKRILGFIGDKKSDNKIENAISFASFDNMKKLERKGFFSKYYGGTLTPGKKDDKNSYKVRKGKVGGYHEHMSKEDIEFCNKKMKKLPNPFYPLN